MRKKKHAWLKMLGWAVVMIGVLGVSGNTEIVKAAGFDAGYIISDYQMGNYNSMSEAEIQSFLTTKNPCGNRDYNYYVRLSSGGKYSWHFANGHFVCLSEERFGNNDNEIGAGETAAHIIWQAAQDYRINPQVLIVLLQKETGLITDPIPNNGDYRKATGYGCPDTAACSSKYYGFKNQIRNAAALFRTVLDGGWTNYPVGNNYIRFSPNASCGGAWVNVRNRATAALYRYTPYQPNAAALAAGYGTAYCGSYGNRNFYLYFNDWFGNITGEGKPSRETVLANNRVATEGTDLELEENAHVADYGWLGAVNGGAMAGTAGYGIRMEAMTLKLKNETGIEYRAHVANVGWMDWVRDGEAAGTTGRALQMEAVQIRLNGELARLYDVYYRVHVADIGWMTWVRNGEIAGTTGKALQMEAVQVKIVRKDLGVGLEYVAHVTNLGWMNWVRNGEIAGTTGRGLRTEAIQIKLPSELAGRGDIIYKVHVATIGWMDWVRNGLIAGTTGRALQMEAMQIKLSETLAREYDVCYRAHVANVGWMKWVCNGETAGTTGRALQMEGMQVELVKK